MDESIRQFMPEFDRAAEGDGRVESATGGYGVDGLGADDVCGGCGLCLSWWGGHVASVRGGIKRRGGQ